VGYLKSFLFDPKQAKSPVSSLSGGERNRLLLAKILARPSELLVLDEPTNDLDMDTLDMLEDMLSEYPGTLLLVSHDREFLDRVVTGTIAMEGDGRAVEYAGGYSDYMTQRRSRPRAGQPAAAAKKAAGSPRTSAPPRRPTKLSYKDARELENLPDRIDGLTTEIAALEARLADADFYASDGAAFAATAARLEAATDELRHAEDRWLELDDLRDSLVRSG